MAAAKKHALNLAQLPVTAGDWVGTFCRSAKRAMTKFAGIGPAVQAFAAKLEQTRKLDLKAARTVLADVFATGGKAFQTVEADVKAEGPPATRNGVKLQAATIAFLDEFVRTFETAVRGIGALPTSSKKAFSKAGKAVIARLEAQVNKLQADANRFSKLSSKEIDTAMSLNPACTGGLFGS